MAGLEHGRRRRISEIGGLRAQVSRDEVELRVELDLRPELRSALKRGPATVERPDGLPLELESPETTGPLVVSGRREVVDDTIRGLHPRRPKVPPVSTRGPHSRRAMP